LRKTLVLVTTIAALFAGAAGAQGTAPAGAANAAAAEVLADGEVRRVDPEQGKVTIKHGEIRNLEMPPMTMVFRAKDPAMLAKLKAGDKIRFAAEQSGGAYVVTRIEPRN